MTRDGDLKRRARERALVTGEPYATARARLATASDADWVDDVGRGAFVWLASGGEHRIETQTGVDPARAARLVPWLALGVVALAARQAQ